MKIKFEFEPVIKEIQSIKPDPIFEGNEGMPFIDRDIPTAIFVFCPSCGTKLDMVIFNRRFVEIESREIACRKCGHKTRIKEIITG